MKVVGSGLRWRTHTENELGTTDKEIMEREEGDRRRRGRLK